MATQNAVPSPYAQLSTQAQWEQLMGAMGVKAGIFGVPGSSNLSPSLDGTSRAIDTGPGYAHIAGHLWGSDTTVVTPIPAASGSDRIDRLVLRLDRNAATEAAYIQPVVITGTPSASPAIPSITRTPDGVYDLRICRWTSKAGGSLTGLTDERDFAALGLPAMTSATRPPEGIDPSPALAYETDTTGLIYWDGNAWRYLGPYGMRVDGTNQQIAMRQAWKLVATTPGSGAYETWHQIHTSDLNNGWAVGGYWKFRITPENELQMAAQDITPGATADTTIILPASASVLPAAYVPNQNFRFPVFCDNIRNPGGSAVDGAGLQIYGSSSGSGGRIDCYGIATIATRLDFQVKLPLDT